MTNIGEAYGFFYYGKDTQDIKKELPSIKDCAQTPSALELTLTEGVRNITTNDPALLSIIKKAEKYHMSHVLKATMPNVGNRRVAQELGDIMNVMYMQFYAQNEPFNAGIVYKIGEKYVFRRE